MKKFVLGLILGALIFGTVGVVAGTLSSEKVAYDNTKSHSSKTTVQDAIDDLYYKADNMVRLVDINPNKERTGLWHRVYYSEYAFIPVAGYKTVSISNSNMAFNYNFLINGAMPNDSSNSSKNGFLYDTDISVSKSELINCWKDIEIPENVSLIAVMPTEFDYGYNYSWIHFALFAN